MTTWLIGADEAGYGPNLGPLVVAATAWRFDSSVVDPREIDLYQLLARAVTQEPQPERIAVADSKQLYKPGVGIEALELAALALHHQPPSTWNQLVDCLNADSEKRLAKVPWHDGFDPELPIEAGQAEVTKLGGSLFETCGSIDCMPSVCARMVFPEEFNELVEYFGSKGAALSHVTLQLVKELTPSESGSSRVYCICDKHGGRNRYGGLLQNFWPDSPLKIITESRAKSCYRLGEMEIAFRTGGEAALPVAWASMTAKYLRELSMIAFNDYWNQRVPGIRRTAGYPVDAKRFKREIELKQVELGIEDAILWRNR